MIFHRVQEKQVQNEVPVSRLENISGLGVKTGASCTVENFTHAKKILLVSVQTEMIYTDEKKM